MSAAVASVIALVVAIVLSMATRLNVGLAALGFAWLLGTFVAGMSAEAIIRGFPSTLFVTLTGMTLLFAAAETNGTLEGLAHRAVGLTGRAPLLPWLFFVIACAISMIRPGGVSGVALMAPLAMAIGARAGVPHFPTALVVSDGANAGNLSPVSAVGIIANSAMARAGLGAHPGKVMFANFAASALVVARRRLATVNDWRAVRRGDQRRGGGPCPLPAAAGLGCRDGAGRRAALSDAGGRAGKELTLSSSGSGHDRESRLPARASRRDHDVAMRIQI